jgi:formylmethanofuran dehydrogenase subunit E
MKTLPEYLDLAEKAHGHLCAGQVLGVRLAMLGLRELGIDDPVTERKRLVTYVEIDRCVTDAVAVVANCRLGKRALKFRDWGKVAATFVDLKTGRAVRVAAKESSKQAARELFPELEKEAGQQKAYAQLSDEILFDKQWVKVEVQPEDLPGFKGPRVVCAECGEGINFKREVVKDGPPSVAPAPANGIIRCPQEVSDDPQSPDGALSHRNFCFVCESPIAVHAGFQASGRS